MPTFTDETKRTTRRGVLHVLPLEESHVFEVYSPVARFVGIIRRVCDGWRVRQGNGEFVTLENELSALVVLYDGRLL